MFVQKLILKSPFDVCLLMIHKPFVNNYKSISHKNQNKSDIIDKMTLLIPTKSGLFK